MIIDGSLSSTNFNLNIYSSFASTTKRIQYESSDGINYTRTRFNYENGTLLENPVDMTTVIEWIDSSTWNDLIGYFMIVGSTTYEGLFNYVSTNNQFEYAPTQLNTIADEVYNKSFYNGNGKFDGTLQNITNLNKDEIKRRVNLYNDLSYLELNSNVTNLYKLFEDYYNLTSVPNFDTSNVTNMDCMFEHCYNLVNIPELNTSNVTSMRKMFLQCNNLSNASIQNIINMCLNSNITNSSYMNLSTSAGYGPLFSTKFDNSYYQNRWSELTAAGWTY